ncbi:hypothetical protein H9Q13_07265 [Pontibacter sp. JH31]|uniref:EpsG family protein n=1 Tax=Pontibacter aquaedesilientis TaxID=2766980 RepID=A0ABR7XF93_9BACT|nr:hypothetical protein [Pontibacter aquaedesilientis]MBD1396959.1 hypothetical protein [Pontibacter aquaedesilientis]
MMGIFDVIILLLIPYLVKVAIPYFSSKAGVKSTKWLYYLWYYHVAFGLIYIVYVNIFGGDALGYWRKSYLTLNQYLNQGQGTAFMHAFNYVFVNVMDISFFTGSMIYTFIGFLGVMFFYLSTVNLVKTNVKVYGYSIFPYIFFLPNLHFWSVGVGKDTLVFFCVGLFLFSVMKPMGRKLGIAIALILSYNIRPHITIFILVSFGVGFLFDNRLKPVQKLFLSFCMAVGAVLIFDQVMNFVKLEELSIDGIEQSTSTRVSNLSRGHTGSSVDISSYPLPLKVFTFLFRPLFFDVHNIMGVFASIENLILLILFGKIINMKTLKLLKQAPYQLKGLFFFFFIGSVAFSTTLGNLGIMMRQKNMLVPGLIIFMFWVLSVRKEELIIKYNRLKAKVSPNNNPLT